MRTVLDSGAELASFSNNFSNAIMCTDARDCVGGRTHREKFRFQGESSVIWKEIIEPVILEARNL